MDAESSNYFVSAFSSCCFVNLLGSGNWNYLLNVSFSRRSNGSFNHCPKTSVQPVVTLLLGNGGYQVNITVTDADGDVIRCRLASGVQECGSICQSQVQAPFILPGCTLRYWGNSPPTDNSIWPVALVIEDYENTTATTPMCSMPLQIAVVLKKDSVFSQFQNSNNCTVSSGQNNNSTSSSVTGPNITTRWWFWLIIAVAGLLLVLLLVAIAIIICCIISKKNKHKHRVEHKPDTEHDSEPDSPRPTEFYVFNGPEENGLETAREKPEQDANGERWNWAGVQMRSESPANGAAAAEGMAPSKAEQAAPSSASASTSALAPPPPPPVYSSTHFDTRPDNPTTTPSLRDSNERAVQNSTHAHRRQSSGDLSTEQVSDEPEIVRVRGQKRRENAI